MQNGKALYRLRIAEDLFDAALRIIEISAHRCDGNIRARLRHHLEPLHGTDAAVGIEHHNLDSIGVCKSLECSLARISGGCDKDEDRISFSLLRTRCTHQLRQKLQCHILERTRRSVPEFEHLEFADRTHGRTAYIIKRMPIGTLHTAAEFLIRIIRQKETQDSTARSS